MSNLPVLKSMRKPNFFSAAGLYYLAELVEEYTVLTAKIIRTLTTVRNAIRTFMSFKTSQSYKEI